MIKAIVKIETLLILSGIGGFISMWFNEFMDQNMNWIIIISLFVIIDTALGVWKGFILNKFSSQQFSKLFTKVVIYAVVVFVAHGMRFAGAEDTSDLAKTFLSWVKESLLIGILVREASSILEKAGAVFPGVVPIWIRKRLKDFDETGNLIIDPPKSNNQQ